LIPGFVQELPGINSEGKIPMNDIDSVVLANWVLQWSRNGWSDVVLRLREKITEY